MIAYCSDCLPSSYWFGFTLKKTFWLHWDESFEKNHHQSLWLANHLLSHSDMNPMFKAILLNASFVLNFHPQKLVLVLLTMYLVYLHNFGKTNLTRYSFLFLMYLEIHYIYIYRVSRLVSSDLKVPLGPLLYYF